MSDTTIKPCPFCGKQPNTWWDIDKEIQWGFNISCCFATVCSDLKSDAIEKWNHRFPVEE